MTDSINSLAADLACLLYTQKMLTSQFLYPPMPPPTRRIRACWRWLSPSSMPRSRPARPGLHRLALNSILRSRHQ
jgi:hypothetical protein